MKFKNIKTGNIINVHHRLLPIFKFVIRSDEYVFLNDDLEHWITLNGGKNEKGEGKGQHVLINGSGTIIGGAGGKLNGTTLGGVKTKSKDVAKPKESETIITEPETEPEKEVKPKVPQIPEGKSGDFHSKTANELSENAKTSSQHLQAKNAHAVAANNISRKEFPEIWAHHYEQYKYHEEEYKKTKNEESKKIKEEFKKSEEGKQFTEAKNKYKKQTYQQIKDDFAKNFNLIIENGMGEEKKAQEKWKEYVKLKMSGNLEEANKVYSEYQQFSKKNPLLPKKQYNLNEKNVSSTYMREILGHVDSSFSDMEARGFDIKSAMAKGKVSFAPSPASTKSYGTAWQKDGIGFFAINPTLLKESTLLEIKERSQKRKEKGLPVWTVDERMGDPLRSTIVHEVSHALGLQKNINSPDKLGNTLQKLYDEGKLVGEKPIPEHLKGYYAINYWILHNISEYATTNIKETDAELCAYVTAKNYVTGTLPKELEDHVYELFGKK